MDCSITSLCWGRGIIQLPWASVCIPVLSGRTANLATATLARGNQREFPSTYLKVIFRVKVPKEKFPCCCAKYMRREEEVGERRMRF